MWIKSASSPLLYHACCSGSSGNDNKMYSYIEIFLLLFDLWLWTDFLDCDLKSTLQIWFLIVWLIHKILFILVECHLSLLNLKNDCVLSLSQGTVKFIIIQMVQLWLDNNFTLIFRLSIKYMAPFVSALKCQFKMATLLVEPSLVLLIHCSVR